MIKITYYHTLYKRETTQIVFGDIIFDTIKSDSFVTFKSGGHGYLVNVKYIKKIEQIETS